MLLRCKTTHVQNGRKLPNVGVGGCLVRCRGWCKRCRRPALSAPQQAQYPVQGSGGARGAGTPQAVFHADSAAHDGDDMSGYVLVFGLLTSQRFSPVLCCCCFLSQRLSVGLLK